MRLRTVSAVHAGHATFEGEGMPVRRPLPGPGLAQLDPFLLLDHFGPVAVGPGGNAGIPPHPHRGFQTLTYLLQGALRHRDSRGGEGRLGPGGAQWMSAAAGILHEEMPEPERMAAGGSVEGVQLWINLPAAQKGGEPAYRDIPAEAMPWRPVAGGRLRSLAGTWAGAEGPVPTPVPMAYAHLELEPGGTFEHPLPAGWGAGAYVLHGAARVGSTPVQAGDLAVLAEDGEGLGVAAEGAAGLLLLAGRPLDEPVARYGPFVMTTEAEIRQALADFRAGRMGRLEDFR